MGGISLFMEEHFILASFKNNNYKDKYGVNSGWQVLLELVKFGRLELLRINQIQLILNPFLELGAVTILGLSK